MKYAKEILEAKKRKMRISQTGVKEHEHQIGHHNHTGKEARYQCPMKCEGEKTYDKPGNCPVCNMHLVPVE